MIWGQEILLKYLDTWKERYIDLLGFIYKLIEKEEIATYKGRVFRATKLD